MHQVVQSDPHTLCIRLRAQARGTPGSDSSAISAEPVTGWLWVCWEPVLARICIGPPPQRGAAAESFTFGTALRILRGFGFDNVCVKDKLYGCGIGVLDWAGVKRMFVAPYW